MKQFGPAVAVRDVTLDIAQSEFVTLLGPSGCGKTTTLRMIAGLEQPTAGQVRLNGDLVNDVPARERNIPLVFQHFVLFPHLNVRRNVAYGLEVRGVERRERDRRVMEGLQLVGLEDLADRRVNAISGGQQQRVALARALVVDPSALLLDEPLGSLDANLRVRMQTELRSMHKRLGIPFIYVTHNQNEALAMSDRVVVMNQGRIEQVDPPGLLFRNPKTRFVAAFIGKNNILDGRITRVSSDVTSLETQLGPLDVPTGDGGFAVGERCAVVFNADKLVMSTSAGDAFDFPARVLGIESVGSLVTALLQAGDVDLHLELHGRSAGDLTVGSEIQVAVDRSAVVLLKDEPRSDARDAKEVDDGQRSV